MRSSRLTSAAAGACCLAWLTLTTGYGAAAALAVPIDLAPIDLAPIDLGGAPVPGKASTSPAEPTPLPAGLWSESLEPQYPQYFSYRRTMKDSVVHVGVLGAPQSTDSDAIRVEAEVQTADSTTPTSCGTDDDSSDFSVAHAVLGASVVAGNEDGSTGDDCRAADTVRIEVSRGSSSNPAELPYVLKIVEEAPLSDSGAEPDEEPDEEPEYDVPEPVAAVDRPGAASLEQAPQLDARSGPVTISTTITEGTELLWRVPLGWGDLPVVRVDVPAATGAAAETLSYGGPELSVHLIDPMRDRLRYVDSEREDSATGEYSVRDEDEPTDPDRLVAAGFPVRPINERLPGDYWISLVAEPAGTSGGEQREPLDIPIELTVEVLATGAPAPSYDEVVISPDKTAGPSGYSAKAPFLIAEDTFSAVASGNPLPAEGEDEAWLSARRGAGLGLGAVSLVCLGAGLFRLRARR